MPRLDHSGGRCARLAPVSRRGRAGLVFPGPKPSKPAAGPWVTGAQYDILNKAQAEHQLQKLQAKLGSDAGRCDAEAVGGDVRRIEYLRYRIAVDLWLIRKLANQDPGCYPLVTDEDSLAYIAQAGRPAPSLPSRSPCHLR